MWEYRRRVKYYETDRMGVVHHSNYLRILEDARMEWLRENLLSYSQLEKMGIIIPAVSASGNFLNFLRYDDPFKVEIILTKFSGVKMTFHYRVINTDTCAICYQGDSSHFFATDNDYKPYLTFRKKYPELYKKMTALCGGGFQASLR
jgi:acyl-CoA thioester hydrolase